MNKVILILSFKLITTFKNNLKKAQSSVDLVTDQFRLHNTFDFTTAITNVNEIDQDAATASDDLTYILENETVNGFKEYSFENYNINGKKLSIIGKVYNSINMQMYVELCSNIETLIIADTSIKSLSSDIFLAIPKVKCIILKNNVLMESLPQSFYILSKLKELYVDKNIFTHLPSSFKNLEKLNLSNFTGINLNNEFKNIKKCTNLSGLYLCNNNLSCIPEYFIKLPKLETLFLSNNRFERLSDIFIILFDTLTNLDLSNNCITSLGSDDFYIDVFQNQTKNFFLSFKNAVFRKNNLKFLNLSNNNLRKYSGVKYGYFKNLQALLLGKNQLKTFPEFGYSYSCLHTLDLSNNKIKFISCNSHIPKHLVNLNLSKNYFKDFPQQLSSLKTLKTLNISKNRIKTISTDVVGLARLEFLKEFTYLNLAYNYLDSLPSNFRQLNVRILDLSNNKFREYPICLYHMANLHDLYIYRNLYELPATRAFRFRIINS